MFRILKESQKMKELKIINLPNKDLKIYGKLDIDREVISRS